MAGSLLVRAGSFMSFPSTLISSLSASIRMDVGQVEEIVSVIEQAIAMPTGAAVLAFVGLLIHRYRSGKRTQRLLRVIYDVARGDPDAIVDSREVVKRAGITHKRKDFGKLLDSGVIRERGATFTEQGVRFTEYSITPTGIRKVEQNSR
jgi:hypothetical protein